MKKALGTFPLYTTTLLMLLGSGLLTTYVSLRLAHEHVSGGIIGGITAANYIGLVIGGKVGHNLIARVGHRACFALCLVPIALTNRTNAQPMTPAPVELGYLFRTIPTILVSVFITGMAFSSFYGMVPVYSSLIGFSTQQTG